MGIIIKQNENRVSRVKLKVWRTDWKTKFKLETGKSKIRKTIGNSCIAIVALSIEKLMDIIALV